MVIPDLPQGNQLLWGPLRSIWRLCINGAKECHAPPPPQQWWIQDLPCGHRPRRGAPTPDMATFRKFCQTDRIGTFWAQEQPPRYANEISTTYGCKYMKYAQLTLADPRKAPSAHDHPPPTRVPILSFHIPFFHTVGALGVGTNPHTVTGGRLLREILDPPLVKVM